MVTTIPIRTIPREGGGDGPRPPLPYAYTGWWGIAFSARQTYNVILDGVGLVKLAGGSGYGSGYGGACVVTVPMDFYVVSIGESGDYQCSPSYLAEGRESWGFGGCGGWFSGYGGPSGYTLYHGGGRTEIRTSSRRQDAIVIAPGGGGGTNAAGGASGGFPDGSPPTAGGYPGGFGGGRGGGGLAATPGGGGGGYATYNYGWPGDGGVRVDGATPTDPLAALGSGGSGGNGNTSFGSGGGGGGGGGGRHGGGGGGGGNGSWTDGNGGGGGSGDVGGASTVIRTASGVCGGLGLAAMQVWQSFSPVADAFIKANTPRTYVPGEECSATGCIVVSDMASGKGFWNREAATIFDGFAAAPTVIYQGQKINGRGAMHVSRNNSHRQSDFQMPADDASSGFFWNPPQFNVGNSWAIEWTQQTISGAVAGPGCASVLTPGNYSPATANQMPWNVTADATHIFLTVQATSMSDPKIASVTLPSRVTTLLTRYGISYRSSTDTFYFYRSDGVTGSVTRTAAGIPTSGQWNLQTWRPLMFSSLTSNAESLIQDVALFDNHRTQAQFMAFADAAVTGLRFNYTGSVQTWTLPTGATGARFTVVGSKGSGGGDLHSLTSGGNGAMVEGELWNLPAGQQFDIYVGSQFQAFGGGRGGQMSGTDDGGNGGDYSAVVEHGITLTKDSAAIIAGGGGGGASGPAGNNGFAAGFPSGAGGNAAGSGGGGGTQTAGGAHDVAGGMPGTDGGPLLGGSAQDGGGLDECGGGGGAGYYGGGAGITDGGYSTPGGAGSSHTRSDVTSVTHTSGYNAGAGYVIVTWW